jgi:hypothetical protein
MEVSDEVIPYIKKNDYSFLIIERRSVSSPGDLYKEEFRRACFYLNSTAKGFVNVSRACIIPSPFSSQSLYA